MSVTNDYEACFDICEECGEFYVIAVNGVAIPMDDPSRKCPHEMNTNDLTETTSG